MRPTLDRVALIPIDETLDKIVLACVTVENDSKNKQRQPSVEIWTLKVGYDSPAKRELVGLGCYTPSWMMGSQLVDMTHKQ